MQSEKTFFEKYYLLLIYSLFLFADCCLLYVGNYGSRIYAKPLLIPILTLWFMSNTAFNIRSSSQTLAARLLLYFVLLCTLVSDVCGLYSDKFVWTSCLFLYSFTYLLYFFMFISIQRNAPEKKLFYIYLKKVIPVFIIIALASSAFINKALKLPFEGGNIWLYAHGTLIALLAGIVANMWSIPQLKKIRLLFAFGVLCLLFTNMVYSIDEIVYHRRHSILDDFVACGNGLSQILIILGVIKFLRFKRG